MDQSANHVLFRGGQPGAADRMRDLLARTVQDRVSDQRSHASALEEIRKHLEGLEWLVKEVRQHELTDLSDQLAAQTAQTARLEQSVAALSGTLDEGLDDKLGALDAKLSGTDGKVGALANRIDRLDDRIGDTDDRIGFINEQIASIDDRIGALVAKVVSAAQAEMTARLDSLEETVLALAEALLRPVRHIADQRRHSERS